MSKVYALLVSGDIVEGVENESNVTTPKSVRAYYRGHHKTVKPITSFARTTENYEHLVALFGSERVPKLNPATEHSKNLLDSQGMILGRVSDESEDDARENGSLVAINKMDRGGFYVDAYVWRYCVPYDRWDNEITANSLQAGDYVMGQSSDLGDIDECQYIVVDNGKELVVFDDAGYMLPIIEGLEMGHFKRIDKE